MKYQLYKKIKQFIVPTEKLKYISIDKCGSVYYSVNKPEINEHFQTWMFDGLYFEIIRAEIDFPDIQDWKNSIRLVRPDEYADAIKLEIDDRVVLRNGRISTVSTTNYQYGGKSYTQMRGTDMRSVYYNNNHLLYGDDDLEDLQSTIEARARMVIGILA